MFFLTCLLAPRAAHRIVGYLGEEAVVSYTRYLSAIDAGGQENVPAPKIVIDYRGLPEGARLRDVAIRVRADEAHHRDTNHSYANVIMEGRNP